MSGREIMNGRESDKSQRVRVTGRGSTLSESRSQSYRERVRFECRRVAVRATGRGPTKGMPVLSGARQRGSSSG
eukprot:354575-Chlamydomonas_euryale.AAC.1